MDKNNKNECLSKIIGFIVLVFFIYWSFCVFYSVSNFYNFENNFYGNTFDLLLKLFIFSISGFIFILEVIIKNCFKSIYNSPNFKWIYWTCTIAFIIWINGFYYINMEWGFPSLNINLGDSNNWKLVCPDKEGNSIIKEELVTCKIIPNNIIISDANITFYQKYLRLETQDFSNLTFIMPNNSNQISVNLIVKDLNNNTFELQGNKGYFEDYFLDELPTNEKKEKFIAYQISLLVAVLFSVPSMMRNLKYVFKEQ